MKLIFRNFIVTLKQFKLASLLNILGLSVAFAACIIIMIQVHYEYTFDTSYKKTGYIYRVESTMIPTESNMSSGNSYSSFLPCPLIETLLPSIPQIEHHTIMRGAPSESYINYATEKGEKSGLILSFLEVSESFGNVFDIEMVEGLASSLHDPQKILLPQSLAKKMFGEQSAIDKQITLQSNNTSYTIGGVYQDFPENTSMINDIKIGMGDKHQNNWMDWAFQLFITLIPDASPQEIEEQLKILFEQTEISKYMGENITFRLTPIEDIYYLKDTTLDIAPKGNWAMTNILLAVSLLVIIIAAINFLNFSTALTPVRIKSINTQRIIGCSVNKLRFALLAEALGICILSFMLALIWTYLFDITGLSSILLTPIHMAQHIGIIFIVFLLSLLMGLIAGLYPAFYMTSFSPAFILKGGCGISLTGRNLRTILTAFQFIVSITLIIGALFLHLQNTYLYNRQGIMNSEQIATLTLDQDIALKYADLLGEKLKNNAFIKDVAFSEWLIGFQDYYLYTYAKTIESEDIRYYFLPVSYNFTQMMELEILEGRAFEVGDIKANEERLIFNGLAAKQFNVKPGDKLSNGCQVVGIVKDFNFMNLRKSVEPMALSVRNPQKQLLPIVYIRTTGNAYKAMEHIKTSMAEIDPLYPANISFYDQQFEQTYQKERNTSAQITMFSLLAVLISLVGVFGLVTFETQYRKKEISLRKVMGANIREILNMFNRRFVFMVTLCFILAIPIAWYGVKSWLVSFAYRIPISAWVFILAFSIVLGITILTVTLQSWRTANTNPINSLKNE